MDDKRDQRPADARPPIAALVVEAVILFLALRIGLSLLGALVATSGVWGPCHFEEALVGWQTMPEQLRDGPAFPLAGIWERWDACWYMKIATYGYEPGERAVAFFPFFPALVRSVGTITTLPYPVAGLIVSALGYVAAMTGLLRLVAASHGLRIARWSMRYLSLFPAAFFLFAPFTEATFLASAVWCLVFARERRWGLALLLGGRRRLDPRPGSAPRGAAGLGGVPRRARGAGFRPASDQPARWLQVALSIAATLAPVAVFLAFGLVARALTGETPYDAQSLWGGTEFHPPWEVVAAAATWAIEHGDGIEALNLAALLGSAGLLIAGVRRMPVTYSLYAWPPLLLIATRIQPTPLTSTMRYVLVLFPVFIVAVLLTERPWLRQAWLIVSTLLLGALTTIFLQGDFVA